MAAAEKPKLRPIEAFPAEQQGRRVVLLRDPTGYSDRIAAVTEPGLYILSLFDGTRSIREVQAEIMRQAGQLIAADQIQHLADDLDQALLLEGETFEAHRAKIDNEFLEAPVRAAHHAGGAYEGDPKALVAQLESILDGHGAQPTTPTGAHESLVALVAPHIDYNRGVAGYRAAYQLLRHALGGPASNTAPDLFVVFGTRHAPAPGHFNLTRKSYATPLGTVPTAADLADRIGNRMKAAGEDAFAGEGAHRTEHSIEFQCVFLRHLMPRRDFEVLPVLCGALEEPMSSGTPPRENDAIARFIDTVREEVARTGRQVLYVAAADLAHVGPHFGDPRPVDEATLVDLGHRDHATMDHVLCGDAEGFFNDVIADGDDRKICGIPPIWATLAVLGRKLSGKLLHYGQAREPEFESVVTFASAALYEA